MPLTEIETAVLEPDALEVLVSALRARGYRVLGPTLRDGAIVYDDLASAAELPIGWTDEQEPGRYRARARARTRRASATRSGRTPGSSSCCPRDCASGERARDGDGFEIDDEQAEQRAARARRRPRLRAAARSRSRTACFLGGRHVDADYAARREGAFVVAVNCFEPGGTCFCVVDGHRPAGGRRATTSR